MKSTSQYGAASAAMPAPARVAEPLRVPVREELLRDEGACPACDSRDYHSALTAQTPAGSRTLVGCTRCGLLRFLGDPAGHTTGTFVDRLTHATPVRTWKDQLLQPFRRWALRNVSNVAEAAVKAVGGEGFVLDCDAVDGAVGRELERRGAACLVITPHLPTALEALHRHDVFAVVASPAATPIRTPLFDAVLRLQGFSGEADPAQWLRDTRCALRPGGRVLLQVFDSASWAFLITGANWAGLHAASSHLVFRGADVEVLLEFAGFAIRRRSTFFPLRNTCIWVSSLFPSLDPVRSGQGREASLWRTLAYLSAVALLLPLGLLESVCQAGSVLLVEAEIR